MHNYIPGDEIYLFGFSRGAYTVRSLGGLIRKVGLLDKRHAEQAPTAFSIYRSRDRKPDTAEAAAFREKFSHYPVRIRFIGVWDTVGRLGIPSWGPFKFFSRRFEFHNVNLSRTVDFAYQALAIDERRGAWKPAVWSQDSRASSQVLEQVWFPGVHMDVGGGYRQRGLSDGTFLSGCRRRRKQLAWRSTRHISRPGNRTHTERCTIHETFRSASCNLTPGLLLSRSGVRSSAPQRSNSVPGGCCVSTPDPGGVLQRP